MRQRRKPQLLSMFRRRRLTYVFRRDTLLPESVDFGVCEDVHPRIQMPHVVAEPSGCKALSFYPPMADRYTQVDAEKELMCLHCHHRFTHKYCKERLSICGKRKVVCPHCTNIANQKPICAEGYDITTCSCVASEMCGPAELIMFVDGENRVTCGNENCSVEFE